MSFVCVCVFFIVVGIHPASNFVGASAGPYNIAAYFNFLNKLLRYHCKGMDQVLPGVVVS